MFLCGKTKVYFFLSQLVAALLSNNLVELVKLLATGVAVGPKLQDELRRVQMLLLLELAQLDAGSTS